MSQIESCQSTTGFHTSQSRAASVPCSCWLCRTHWGFILRSPHRRATRQVLICGQIFAYGPVATISPPVFCWHERQRCDSDSCFHHMLCFPFFFNLPRGKVVWITSARWSLCHWTRLRTWLPRRSLWPCTPTMCPDAPSSTPTTRWAGQGHVRMVKRKGEKLAGKMTERKKKSLTSTHSSASFSL